MNFLNVDVKYEPGAAPLMHATSGSAGFDLRCYPYDKHMYLWPLVVVKGMAPVKVSLGVRLAIPHGYFGLIAPRSGLGSKGLAIANTIGIIDSDYRGLVVANLINTQEEPIKINIGDRILQLLILKHENVRFSAVDALELTERIGGYGSTGVA